MSPIITQQRKKQQKLIYVVILVILVTGSVVYFGVLGGGVPSITITRDGSTELLRMTVEIKLKTGVLSDDKFLNLAPYEKLPTDIETGRENPFLPY